MKRPLRARQAGGFTLLEVLIAMIVLAFGLLGFALLQTMNVRFVQSANYRTQATTLAYDLTEQMRSNRYQAGWYTSASFAPGSMTAEAVCSRDTGAVTIAQKISRWQCGVVKALGDDAGAEVTYAAGVVNVAITWGDQRWDPDDPDKATTFALATEL
ncbi:type IV pilus modification protein PilV [Stenotrophomonas maltophilia]|jgi:type IV pilus assembly protein PilV|uniref:type IV pilus modification protein PilV n=1 Tax=Stenotrophomonas maltophilia TaxID=40324 RepID=UPI0034DB2EBF